MGWTNTALRHLRAFVRIGGIECEIEAELRFHIEMRTLEHIEAGMPVESARQQALKQFGDFEAMKRQCAAVRREALTARITKAVKLLSWALAIGGLKIALTSEVEAARHGGQVLVAIAILLRLFFYLRAAHHQKPRPLVASQEKILFDDEPHMSHTVNRNKL
jgi:hypothetical protein